MKLSASFEKLNTSRVTLYAVCTIILLLMLLCNFRTNLVADDYTYCFSFADSSRIDSVFDIIPSMAAHRLSMNGRIAAHSLVQLFLLLPLPVFKVLNSLMFVALVWLMYRLSRTDGAQNALLLLTLFGGLWVLQSDFGQVFLWLDGAVNYLWCAVLSLLFLMPYVNKFLSGRDLGVLGTVCFTLFSFVVGGYSENSTVAIIFMALLLLMLTLFYKRDRLKLWCLLSLSAAMLGFMLMMLAPAEFQNKSAEFSLQALLWNFQYALTVYWQFWPLLLSFALLYTAAVKTGTEKSHRLLSLVFLGGSLAGHFVLTFASYIAQRSTYISLVLLLIACCILFERLFSGRLKLWLSAMSAVCLAFTLYWGCVGVADINRTYQHLSFNEELLLECAGKGEMDVQLPCYYAETKYSAITGLAYLDTEDTEFWANQYMADYYGVDTIIGY